MPTPPDKWTSRPIWAQDPTVTQVSTMVPLPTWAPRLTKQGISTTLGAIKAERRTIAPGTARKPASTNSASPQPSNFDGTLSHHVLPPIPPAMARIGCNRNDSRIAFFSH